MRHTRPWVTPTRSAPTSGNCGPSTSGGPRSLPSSTPPGCDLCRLSNQSRPPRTRPDNYPRPAGGRRRERRTPSRDVGSDGNQLGNLPENHAAELRDYTPRLSTSCHRASAGRADLAGFGLASLTATRVTLQRKESPRISPIEPYLADGQLLTGGDGVAAGGSSPMARRYRPT